MFTVDGTKYNVKVPYGSLKRTFEIREGPGSLSFLDGDEDPDIIGTYYNYELQIDASRAAPGEYDSLFEVLSAPKASHTVSFPYGQSTLSFQARITGGSDQMGANFKGKRQWGGLTIEFKAKEPQRRPAT